MLQPMPPRAAAAAAGLLLAGSALLRLCSAQSFKGWELISDTNRSGSPPSGDKILCSGILALPIPAAPPGCSRTFHNVFNRTRETIQAHAAGLRSWMQRKDGPLIFLYVGAGEALCEFHAILPCLLHAPSSRAKVLVVEPDATRAAAVDELLEFDTAKRRGLSSELLKAALCLDSQPKAPFFRFSAKLLGAFPLLNTTFPELFSLDRDVVVLGHKENYKRTSKNPGYNESAWSAMLDHIEEVSVTCLSPRQLLQKLGVAPGEVDHISIDAHGYNVRLARAFLAITGMAPQSLSFGWEAAANAGRALPLPAEAAGGGAAGGRGGPGAPGGGHLPPLLRALEDRGYEVITRDYDMLALNASMASQQVQLRRENRYLMYQQMMIGARRWRRARRFRARATLAFVAMILMISATSIGGCCRLSSVCLFCLLALELLARSGLKGLTEQMAGDLSRGLAPQAGATGAEVLRSSCNATVLRQLRESEECSDGRPAVVNGTGDFLSTHMQTALAGHFAQESRQKRSVTMVHIGPKQSLCELRAHYPCLSRWSPRLVLVEPDASRAERLHQQLQELVGTVQAAHGHQVIHAAVCLKTDPQVQLYRFAPALLQAYTRLSSDFPSRLASLERQVLVDAHVEGYGDVRRNPGYNYSDWMAMLDFIQPSSTRCLSPADLLSEAGVAARDVGILLIDAGESNSSRLANKFLATGGMKPQLLRFAWDFASNDDAWIQETMAPFMEELSGRGYQMSTHGQHIAATQVQLSQDIQSLEVVDEENRRTIPRYWAVPGCPFPRGDLQPEVRLWRQLAPVRCCHPAGDQCESRTLGCLDQELTWSGADAFCRSFGLRLCTRAELEGGLCCEEGCSLDRALVWTSTGWFRPGDSVEANLSGTWQRAQVVASPPDSNHLVLTPENGEVAEAMASTEDVVFDEVAYLQSGCFAALLAATALGFAGTILRGLFGLARWHVPAGAPPQGSPNRDAAAGPLRRHRGALLQLALLLLSICLGSRYALLSEGRSTDELPDSRLPVLHGEDRTAALVTNHTDGGSGEEDSLGKLYDKVGVLPLPRPHYCGGGGLSGPDVAATAVLFEAASFPLPPFTLAIRIRPSHLDTDHAILSWSSLEENQRGGRVDLLLTRGGGILYGELNSSAWQTVTAEPSRCSLADEGWHTVVVMRTTGGEVRLFADGRQVGQGLVSAAIPEGLTTTARSARLLRWEEGRADHVFDGDMGPLHIYRSGFTSTEVGALRGMEACQRPVEQAGPAPSKAGCHVWMPSGCPARSSAAGAAGATHWQRDEAGERGEHHGNESQRGCEVERKMSLDSECGVSDSLLLFVRGTPTCDESCNSTESSWMSKCQMASCQAAAQPPLPPLWPQLGEDRRKCLGSFGIQDRSVHAVEDQAHCQAEADAAGYAFYSYRDDSSRRCSISSNCTSPTQTLELWRIFAKADR